ncbi:MAG TPA: DUF4062 domain-containing protein [Flavisolibacter sp.]|jgi:hypothetical protein|nr:DUF4062 domain-containing protein [Flavisolibacter sp.]
MVFKKKLQVFVSSTYTDLIEERQAAVEAILTAGHIPAGMELFAAGDDTQWNTIKRWIDESDVFLLILGGRYGSLETESGKSYTQLEYEYAISTGKSYFSVVASEKFLDVKIEKRGRKVLEEDNVHLLKEFRKLVTAKMVKFYDDIKDIKLAILETLSEFNRREDLKGWIPGGQEVDTGVLAEQIAHLTKENSELREKLSASSLTSEPQYSTLTYNQMYQLLKAHPVHDWNGITNLLDVVLYQGQSLVGGYFISKADKKLNAFHYLEVFKIVKSKAVYEDYGPYNHPEIDPDLLGHNFQFTQDGHNFYLKFLALKYSA